MIVSTVVRSVVLARWFFSNAPRGHSQQKPRNRGVSNNRWLWDISVLKNKLQDFEGVSGLRNINRLVSWRQKSNGRRFWSSSIKQEKSYEYSASGDVILSVLLLKAHQRHDKFVFRIGLTWT